MNAEKLAPDKYRINYSFKDSYFKPSTRSANKPSKNSSNQKTIKDGKVKSDNLSLEKEEKGKLSSKTMDQGPSEVLSNKDKAGGGQQNTFTSAPQAKPLKKAP